MIQSNSPYALSTSLDRRGAAARGCLIGVAAVLLLALALGGCVAGRYNALQDGRTTVEGQLSELDNQYKRRTDLVDNLVATVKGAADFEAGTLKELTEARASVGSIKIDASALEDPALVKQYLDAQQNMGGALSRLLAVAENYPQLQATQAFRDLMVQLEGTENRIAVARGDWITSIRDYNATLRKFPGNVIGGMFNFEEFEQYEAETQERDTPVVDFGGGE